LFLDAVSFILSLYSHMELLCLIKGALQMFLIVWWTDWLKRFKRNMLSQFSSITTKN